MTAAKVGRNSCTKSFDGLSDSTQFANEISSNVAKSDKNDKNKVIL